MSLHDVDKDSIDRGSPMPNTNDTIINGAIKSHKTLSTHYTTDADTNTGRLQMQNKQILGNDGTTNITLYGFNQALNKWGFFVTKPGVEVTTNTDLSQFIFNSSQDTFKIANIVTGSYTITATDVSNGYANFSFPHGLSIVPAVEGSFTNTADNAKRQLPYFWQNQTQTYFQTGAPGAAYHIASATVEIYSVDSTNINISVKIIDILGTSWLLTNSVLSFKFYCQQETIVGS